MAPLHRAIALAQVNSVLELIGHHLDFNVAWVLKKLLHVNRWVAKCSTGLGLGGLHRVNQRCFRVHHAHASAATPARGLDDDRVTHAFGDAAHLHRVIGQLTF